MVLYKYCRKYHVTNCLESVADFGGVAPLHLLWNLSYQSASSQEAFSRMHKYAGTNNIYTDKQEQLKFLKLSNKLIRNTSGARN